MWSDRRGFVSDTSLLHSHLFIGAVHSFQGHNKRLFKSMLGLSRPQDGFESLPNGFVYEDSAFKGGQIETDLSCTDI